MKHKDPLVLNWLQQSTYYFRSEVLRQQLILIRVAFNLQNLEIQVRPSVFRNETQKTFERRLTG